VEVVSMFALIMLFIWKLRAIWPLAWVPAVGLIVLSNARRREGLDVLGLRWRDFSAGIRPGILFVAAIVGIAVGAAILADTLRPVEVGPALAGIGLYCLWGLFQQYILNGFFLNRLREITRAPHTAPLVAAALFSLAHLPNPLLMAVTFALGIVAAEFYLRYRNLLFLGLAHGIIGSVVFLVFPDSISHHLRVGPGYIAYCQYFCGGAHLWLAWL
jgi:membrane protease YdiL (CAAX protease family)